MPANVMRMDPTRTTTIRRKIEVDFQRRYKDLARAFKTYLLTDFIQMKLALLPSEQILLRTNEWMDSKFNEVFDYENGDLSDFIMESYIKGANRSYSLMKNPTTFPSKAIALGAAAEFIRRITTAPESRSNFGLIRINAVSQYKMLNMQLNQSISRIVAEGLLSGATTTEMASKISETINSINKTRARLIARTETIRAHAEGQLDAYEALGLQNVGVMAEWSAAADACPKCAPMDGAIFTLAEAHGLIPLHPNCRCLWLPVQNPKKI